MISEKDRYLIKKCISERWQPFLNGKIGWGEASCALCDEYLREGHVIAECAGCPILAKTGEVHCRDTPYYNAHELYTLALNGIFELIPEANASVKMEIDFLNSLLEG